jgi:hypothetical protein
MSLQEDVMTKPRAIDRFARGIAVCVRTLQELSRFLARPGTVLLGP